MTFLPVVQRELLEASRRRGTYRVRLGVAAVGLLIGGWIMLIPFLRTPQQLGMSLFAGIAVAAYLYSLLIGIFRTADCLSEEKRDSTLGLLFLTDLKGYDIVFGKLAATSLNAFYGLLALFPVMAIPLLVGGVTVNEFWRVVLVALNNMFFSLSVGLFCSALGRDERKAMATAFAVVFFFVAGFPILAGILEDWHVTKPLQLWKYLLVPSPGYASVMAFDAAARGAAKANYFAASVVVTHALSWLFLIAASFIIQRSWQDKAADRGSERRNRIEFGAPEHRRRCRRELLELNPICWLIARHRMKAVSVWLFLGLGVLVWLIGLSTHARDWKHEAAYIWTAIIAHTVFKYWIASEATRRFSSDRQSGALELLLSTPLPVPSILRGQTMALERQFALPMGFVLLVDFIFLLNSRSDSASVLFWIAIMVAFVADTVTLTWVGMWRGLNSRHPNRAAAAAILLVLVLPWTVFAMIGTLYGVSGVLRDLFGNTSGVEGAILFWLAISLVVDGLLWVASRRRLFRQFRSVATTRFDAPRHGLA